MHRRTNLLGPFALSTLILGSTLMAAEEGRTLFEFQKPEVDKQWQTVNDGVMGGVSDGQFRITDQKTMEFFGTLSLENNGGFTSVRSRPKPLDLRTGDTIVARVRGDGREYTLNLYVPRRRVAFSYRATFKTKQGEWIEVRVPLDRFEATSFGRVVAGESLTPSEVNSLGILLGDKQAGPFRLEIEWLKVIKSPSPESANPSR